MMTQAPRFEDAPYSTPPDETAVNLRAYLDAIPADKLSQYSSEWSDEQLQEWDGNFRSDGCLMMVCCDRDVDAAEYRETLESLLRFRAEQAASAG